MAKFLRLVNGIPRSFEETASVAIYDEYLLVVSGAPSSSNEVTGPITAGTNLTLPNSGTYTDEELIVDLNGQTMESVFDFNFVGVAPRTQVAFTFGLVVGDRIDFRKYRN